MSAVRTRFAPSPTGLLHVGGVRTALFNYLYAKQNRGQFILRLEDTDRERFVPKSVEQIVEALDWLGLRPDEGFWISEGKHQNVGYIQSERHKAGFYQRFAEELVDKKLAYYSPTTPAKLDKLREQARQKKQPFIYRRLLDKANSSSNTQNAPIRLDIERVRSKLASDSINWQDQIRGKFTDKFDIIEDFVLVKSDSFPTYNFANVIDDHDMKITHVIRGDEFMSSTAKHVLLYKLLDWPLPVFVHLPVINGTDGKKLSKRTGDTDALEYQKKGYLPEALLNFLALLGWNDSTEQEVFSLDELVKKFKLEQLNVSPAVFDPKRLEWMNGHYVRHTSLDELYKKVKNFWPKEANNFDYEYKKKVLALVQQRLKYFAELSKLTKFFFVDLPINPELIGSHQQLSQCERSDLAHWLELSRQSLEQSDFTEKDLTKRLNGLLKQTGQKPALLFSLIRIATTQAPASPELAPTLAVLGKNKVIERIRMQLSAL